MYAAGTFPKKHVEVICQVIVTQRGAPNYHVDPRLYDVATSYHELQGSMLGSNSRSKVRGASLDDWRCT